jgi:hypothetical protein
MRQQRKYRQGLDWHGAGAPSVEGSLGFGRKKAEGLSARLAVHRTALGTLAECYRSFQERLWLKCSWLVDFIRLPKGDCCIARCRRRPRRASRAFGNRLVTPGAGIQLQRP